MTGKCVECARITTFVAEDGYFFLCPLHDQTLLNVSRVPEGLLTERELQVALFVADGYNNVEIADELGLAHGYVRNVVSSVMNKLVVPRRQIIRYVRRWRIF